ncbi:MAG: type II secretion system F family protein [Elusimicrobia bacterium]|nr:type II secretion system F family protein [Elusimicrobiota bacterium]
MNFWKTKKKGDITSSFILHPLAFGLFLVSSLIPQPSALLQAAVLKKHEMAEVNCAALKMQLFYYYLAPERDPKLLNYSIKCRGKPVAVKMPKWVETAVPAMLSNKVWRDPEEGEISEAALWQTPVSIVYEFLELTRKTFPREENGAEIQPGLLVKEYADIRIRFQMSLDRLYRAKRGDSMEGRGRSQLAVFNLILREMESIADAISSSNQHAYAAAVAAIAVLSQDSFSILFKAPRVYSKPGEISRSQEAVFTAAGILGIILVFLAVRLYFMLNEKKTEELVNDYSNKVSKWTDDFSRQFIDIKVHYLVFVPAGLFALAGLLTFNLFAFLFFSLLGMYVGLKTPAYVLNYMRVRRGLKIDTQLMDGLILLSNALRSGLDIVQGFEMVSKDLLPPISDEFGLVIKNYQLGMTFEKALGVMEERVISKMLSYMIRAVVLQRQMGGNLTRVFERIVVDIREESKLEEKTKAMTAQQRIQSIVVGIMPWIMLGVMFLFQPNVMFRFYGKPFGMAVFIGCAIWIAIGMKVVAMLGKIKV